MGRHTKIVETKVGIERRETGYYSTPTFISEFIASSMIALNPNGRFALDPCVGRGEMTLPLMKRGISVDGIDILSLKTPADVSFRQQDFLNYYKEKKNLSFIDTKISLPYDFYIANPPYNCHEVSYIRENKHILSTLFSDVGVHNMYSMFLSALIDCAKDGALIGMITLDSFLTSKAHTNLRKKILDQCAVHYLVLCPNDLFLTQSADVRTCIIILQKGKVYQQTVQVANRPLSTLELVKILKLNIFLKLPLEKVFLSSHNDNYEFIIEVPDEIREMFSYSRLGDTFKCITGISTGDDTRYLSKTKCSGYSVPFYKNPGSCRFFTAPNAYLVDNFLSIAKEVPNFIVRNKKFLYQPGITCSSMGVPFTASYLPSKSTYGVNANIITNESDTWWLLAYLNSTLVTFLVRGILNRSNMITSGYVARIPVPKISSTIKQELSQIAQQAHIRRVSSKEAYKYVSIINNLIYKELPISEATIRAIEYFSQNILRAT